jgi:hypothetical protein
MLSRNSDLYEESAEANHKSRLLDCFRELISKFQETAKKSEFPDSLLQRCLVLLKSGKKRRLPASTDDFSFVHFHSSSDVVSNGTKHRT